MNISIKTSICLATAAVFGLALGAQAQTDTEVLFRGSLQGQETDTLQGNPPEQILVDGRVTGVATHLGRFTMTYKLTVSLPAGSATGSAQWVAENGDTISTTIVGQGEFVPGIPDLNRIVEINIITGGTGRFEGAKGSFTLERLLNFATGLTSGSFHGQIVTSPGGNAQNHANE